MNRSIITTHAAGAKLCVALSKSAHGRVQRAVHGRRARNNDSRMLPPSTLLEEAAGGAKDCRKLHFTAPRAEELLDPTTMDFVLGERRFYMDYVAAHCEHKAFTCRCCRHREKMVSVELLYRQVFDDDDEFLLVGRDLKCQNPRCGSKFCLCPLTSCQAAERDAVASTLAWCLLMLMVAFADASHVVWLLSAAGHSGADRAASGSSQLRLLLHIDWVTDQYWAPTNAVDCCATAHVRG